MLTTMQQPSERLLGKCIFISYARKDGKVFAQKLLKSLELNGFPTWFDNRDIQPGKWDKSIDNAIRDSWLLIFVMTTGGIESENCHNEWTHALDLKKTVLPLMVELVEPPFGLHRHHYIDFTSDCEAAMITLSEHLNSLRHTTIDARRTGQRSPVGIRDELLDEVKREVEGRLESSLHNTVLLQLPKEEQPEQVKRSWDIEVKVGKHLNTQLPSGTTIINIFAQQEIAGKLLILGVPGAGKTTTMLELARDLIARAENDASEPVPVLVTLSTWKDDKQSVAEWLVAETKSKYGIRLDTGKQWLKNRQFLPLLDGLDELAFERQELCIQAINQFQQDCRPKHLVVCCRLVEYQNSNTKLQLNGAIYLQSLTVEQIRDYLVSAHRAELWQSVADDPDILKLVKSPLLLSILTLAFEEISILEWQRFNTAQERRQYLFDAYIQHMLAREINAQSYHKGKEPTRKQTLHWLVWLAKTLHKEAQTEFLLEKMQPTLLPTRTQRRLYRIGVGLIGGLIGGLLISDPTLKLVSGVTGGFIGGLIVGLVGEFLIQLSEGTRAEFSSLQNKRGRDRLAIGLLGSLLAGLIYGLAIGLAGGLAGGLIVAALNGSTGGMLSVLSGGAKIGLTGGLVSGLIGGLIGEFRRRIAAAQFLLKAPENKTGSKLPVGLKIVLIFGLIFVLLIGLRDVRFEVLKDGITGGLIGGLLVELRETISPVETLNWSWGRAGKGLTVWTPIGLIIGLIGGLVGMLAADFHIGLIVGLALAFLFGLIFGLIGILVEGLSGQELERRTVPNQGIWKSAVNAGIFALIGGLVFGPIIGLIYGLVSGPQQGIENALLWGLIIGSGFGLYPATACIKHFTLRVLLCWSGSIPWNFARFLNYAKERIFLQRVGGRYRFIHPLLQEHLAQMEPD